MSHGHIFEVWFESLEALEKQKRVLGEWSVPHCHKPRKMFLKTVSCTLAKKAYFCSLIKTTKGEPEENNRSPHLPRRKFVAEVSS